MWKWNLACRLCSLSNVSKHGRPEAQIKPLLLRYIISVWGLLHSFLMEVIRSLAPTDKRPILPILWVSNDIKSCLGLCLAGILRRACNGFWEIKGGQESAPGTWVANVHWVLLCTSHGIDREFKRHYFFPSKNSQNKKTQMSFNGWMDEQNVVYSCDGILSSHKKEWSTDTGYKIRWTLKTLC